MKKKLHKRRLIKYTFLIEWVLLLTSLPFIIISFFPPYIENMSYQIIHICGASAIIVLFFFFLFIQIKYSPIQFDEEKITITKYKLFRINKIVQQQVFYYKDIESIQFRNRSILNFLVHNDQDVTIFLKNGKNEWIVLNYYVYFLSKRMILKAFKTFKKKELIPQ